MLDYFINKVCTITTLQINFRFKEEQMMDYSMGRIESINENGILLTHLITKCKTYIFFPHIVSISEEQELYEDNPEHAKIIAEYKQKKPEKKESSPFINPTALAELAKKAKEFKN